MIAYATDTTPQFEIGTVATHSCNAGYTLVGDMIRTCEDDDQADIVGVWSGTAPTCERKQIVLVYGYQHQLILYWETVLA